jgi:tryptophanyl-tRNA synthetase
VGIYAALTDQSEAEVLLEFSGEGFGKFKPLLADCLINTISPIRDEMNKLLADTSELDRILIEGSIKAQAISEPIVSACKGIMGFVHSGK